MRFSSIDYPVRFSAPNLLWNIVKTLGRKPCELSAETLNTPSRVVEENNFVNGQETLGNQLQNDFPQEQIGHGAGFSYHTIKLEIRRLSKDRLNMRMVF